MRTKIKFISFVFLINLLVYTNSQAKTFNFSNMTWKSKDGFGGVGRNHWSSKNVWVDSKGWLHLKITHVNGTWHCPEVYTTSSLGFGQYWFYIIGQVDNLDPNVVFGLFNYPSKDIGLDGTNEIDIEFSKWGVQKPRSSNISYTVWPAILEPNKTTLSYTMKLNGNYSTYGFIWEKNKIFYQSSYGHYEEYRNPILTWMFSPPDSRNRIPQKPLPVHINLWLLNGTPPMDGKEVEVIVKQFCYRPIEGNQSSCETSKMHLP